MAKIEFKGIDKYADTLSSLGKRAEGICKYAVYPAAGLVIEAIKANTPVDSGDLRQCISLEKFENESGYVHTEVYFPGYDHKGVPNPVKARVLESGNSTHTKRPFIRPAVNRVRKQAEQMISTTLDEKIKEIMEKG